MGVNISFILFLLCLLLFLYIFVFQVIIDVDFCTVLFFLQLQPRKRALCRGTKVCKAEEVRKYFVNPKIESFRLVCKLHYLLFGFQIYISSRPQMFFGTGALKNFAMLEFLANKVAGLQAFRNL